MSQPIKDCRAEVIAIGDELTSGVRLDTNSQWLSQRLGDLGIRVDFQTTVGDELEHIVQVLRAAVGRSDIVLMTGGLGPTADDLTRHAIAKMAGVELEKNDAVLEHIQRMYQSRKRAMPANNEIQAWFPSGSQVIDNPEGTAPGIDFYKPNEYRLFALPGVPVEMKQMWELSVEPAIRNHVGVDFVIHHHTIHCFGSGESHIESLLPGIVARGRDPQVGITASSATISLRVSTRGDSTDQCIEKMTPTLQTIRDCLGDYVYGENGQNLEDIVVEILETQHKRIALVDFGTNGAVGKLIAERDTNNQVLASSKHCTNSATSDLVLLANEEAQLVSADYGIAIGTIDRNEETVQAGNSHFDVAIASANNSATRTIRFSGHSGWREVRAAKEVLNFVRLNLLGKQN